MQPEHPRAVGLPAQELAHGKVIDADLARAAEAGDKRAFAALYEAHFDFVFRTCRRLGLGNADAEDAAQEVFLVASRKLGAFREGKFTTWLFRIAANVVSSRHRKRRVREALFTLWVKPDEPEPQSGPDKDYDRTEASVRVRQVLSRMAPKKREVFALFELEGLSGEEIAERVGCPIDTVWTRLFHARKEFEKIARQRGVIEDVGSGEQS
jgi:RNA polymerase sigma-70 factor, ECF subfamily